MATDRQQALYDQFGQHYPAGAVLVRQGDRGGHLYMIVRGDVDIAVREEGSSHESIVRRAHPGQFVGVTSCFTGLPHTATLIAASNALVLRLPPSAVDNLVHANPNFAIALIEELVGRLRGATDRRFGIVPRTVQAPDAGSSP